MINEGHTPINKMLDGGGQSMGTAKNEFEYKNIVNKKLINSTFKSFKKSKKKSLAMQ